MRIVADTNTVLSGLLWQGPPRRLLDLARAQAVTLCTSAGLIEELAEIIAREKFAQRLRAAGLSAKALVEDYLRMVELIVPQSLPEPVCRDPDDDHVLACALAAKASAIATGDEDLLVLKEHRGIAILTAAEVLQRLSGS